MSKIYRVSFWYTSYGVATHIEANSEQEAENWLLEELSQNGLDDIEYRFNDREYGVQDAEVTDE